MQNFQPLPGIRPSDRPPRVESSVRIHFVWITTVNSVIVLKPLQNKNLLFTYLCLDINVFSVHFVQYTLIRLRRVFGPKRDEVTGEWRKLHNEELRDLYSLPNIVRVVKSRRMRWAWHVARMGEVRGVHRFLSGENRGKEAIGETQT